MYIWECSAKEGKGDWDRKTSHQIQFTRENSVAISLVKGITDKLLKWDRWAALVHQTESKEQYSHSAPVGTIACMMALHYHQPQTPVTEQDRLAISVA